MKQQAHLMNLLNLRPGEGRPVLLMLAQYFFFGAAMLFVQSASLALFFTAWDATAMPYIYLGIAVIVSSITALFLKISERTSLARFLVLCILFLLVGTLALRLGLALSNSKWLLLALPVWSQTLVNISATAFWALAGNLFDVRQGKRIFGLMNAGSWLAYVVMGPLTTPLVTAFGTENLFLVIALCLLLGFIFQQITLRQNPHTAVIPVPETGPAPVATPSLLRSRYLLLIFASISLWRIAYFVLDNIFYDRAALQYPSAEAMAAFIGGFYGLVGALGFVVDIFLTGRIISRFGLRVGLLVTPLTVTFLVILLALTGTMDASLLLPLFWFAVAGKFINEGLGFSLDQSAFALTYQPLAEKVRARAQTIAEGIVQPLAIGLAGGLLLVFNTLLKFNVIQLAYVYILFGLAWLLTAWLMARDYPRALADALRKRRFGEKGLSLRDPASQELIQQALDSPHDAECLYALDVLAKSEHPSYRIALPRLLASPHAKVRLEVLGRVEKERVTEALPAVEELLEHESLPKARETASRALSALEKSRGLNLLNHPDPATRSGALIGLLRSHPLDDLPVSVWQIVTGLATSDLELDRLEAARLARECANAGLAELLLVLLSDGQLAVRQAALRAASKVRHPALYPAMISALGQPATRSLAFSALVSGGEMALPAMTAALRQDNLHHRVRLRLVRACGHMRGEVVNPTLVRWLEFPNTILRSRVLAALRENRFKPSGEAAQPLEAQILVELRRCAWLLAGLCDLGTDPHTETVTRALEHDMETTRTRLFALFACLYDDRLVERARQAILQKDASRAAYAIEIMDTTLKGNHKTGFVPLLENFPPRERLKKMGSAYRQPELRPAGRLMELLSGSQARENPWLVATALAAAPYFGIPRTDIRALNLQTSNVTLLARMVAEPGTEKPMLSTVERVLILKTLSIFADTPDEALAELAELVEEVTALAGEVIVREGEPGQSLYVIVRGQVEVVDDNRVINRLGERAVFGELSLLDSSPRTATIRAIDETTLLRIDQAPFYELMSDYVEVALGTIHMLTRNLRARTSDVLELNRMLKSEKD